MDYFENVLEAVGNTPLIRLGRIERDEGIEATVLAKVEYMNPGGSVKDRPAIKMLEVAEKEGLLKPGGTVVEPTSGNTGAGLALAAAVRGYRCICVMPEKASKEKQDLLKAMGAEVVLTPAAPPEDPESYYRTILLHERVRLDLGYLEKRCVRSDLRLLSRQAAAILLHH